jgi:hypothetical protein
MFRSLAAAAVVGALVAYGFRPTKTTVKKMSLLGPKTGATYTVEDFTDAGFTLVTAADGSRAVFQRANASPMSAPGQRGFVWQHGKGKPETLRAIYLDIIGEPPPASAVGPKVVPNPAEVGAANAPRGAARPKAAPAPSAPPKTASAPKANRTTP